jgi:hypothetical protein
MWKGGTLIGVKIKICFQRGWGYGERSYTPQFPSPWNFRWIYFWKKMVACWVATWMWLRCVRSVGRSKHWRKNKFWELVLFDGRSIEHRHWRKRIWELVLFDGRSIEHRHWNPKFENLFCSMDGRSNTGIGTQNLRTCSVRWTVGRTHGLISGMRMAAQSRL